MPSAHRRHRAVQQYLEKCSKCGFRPLVNCYLKSEANWLDNALCESCLRLRATLVLRRCPGLERNGNVIGRIVTFLEYSPRKKARIVRYEAILLDHHGSPFRVLLGNYGLQRDNWESLFYCKLIDFLV